MGVAIIAEFAVEVIVAEAVRVSVAVGAASARVLRMSGGRKISLPELSTNRYGKQRRFVIVRLDKVLMVYV